MTRTSSVTSLLLTLLCVSMSQEILVSAQAWGTVPSALFDYIMKNNNNNNTPQQSSPTGPASPSSSTTPPQQQTTDPSAANTVSDSAGSGSSLYDIYSMMMQPSPQTTSSPWSPSGASSGMSSMDVLSQMSGAPQTQTHTQGGTSSSSTSGGSSAMSSMDVINQMSGAPQTQTQTQGGISSSPTSGGSSATSYMDVFNQMSGGSQTQTQGASSTGSASSPPGPMNFYNQPTQAMNPSSPQVEPQNHSQLQVLPFADAFSTTTTPVTLEPTPNILSFVPPQWNNSGSNTQHQSAWGSSPSNAIPGWGHNTGHQSLSGWSYNTPRHHTPAKTPQISHLLSKMIMMPQFRKMIKNQATKFGDIAYYQQHGCVDPIPTKPGAGGIQLTQTLKNGCNSLVSKMVCMRVGKQASGTPNTMALIMSMLNPAMTRTFEKCLTPKMVTQMMFQGFSGGSGGMNPMMMMALNGGGGGGMAAMLPMIMATMNQQNQAAAPSATSNIFPPAPAGTGFSFGFGSPTANKHVYPDPSQANILVSQAARIPMGAAQPSAQTSGSSLMSAFSSLFGMGDSQIPPSSGLHPGTATLGSVHASSAQGPASRAGDAGIDCSSVMPLIMSKMTATGEALNSPEAMEVIGQMRKQYLPYSCQELRTKYTGLPFEMCCPGKVDPPTVLDLLKIKNAAAA